MAKENFLIFITLLISLFLAVSCGDNSSSLTSPSSETSSITSGWDLSFTNNLAKLPSPGRHDSQYFGQSVAVGDFNGDGNPDMAIGAHLADLNNSLTNGADTGSVYIYYSINSSDNITAADLYLTAGSDFNNQYGHAVHAGDINNDGIDDLMIGAPFDDRAGANSGSVYIHHGSNSGISTSPTQIINQPNANANDSFGSSLFLADLDGNGYKELLVGAILSDTPAVNVGRVWVLTGQSNSLFTTSASMALSLSAALDTTQDYCGWSLWVHDYNNDGNKDIYMGCPRSDLGGTADVGKVFIYHGTGVSGTWVTSANTPDVTLTNPVPAASDYFGTSIAIMDYDNDGNSDLIIGAQAADDGFAGSGTLYIYNNIRANTGVDILQAPPYSSVTGDYYGSSMDVADTNKDGINDLIVGAPLSRHDSTYIKGRVNVLNGTSTGTLNFTTANKTISYNYHKAPTQMHNSSADYFGTALCTVDFNADGLQDLVVGAYHGDEKYTDDGAAYVYYTKTSGAVYGTPDIRLTSPGAWNTAKEFGSSCLGIDLNRDGYEDLLVGAWQDDISVANGGAVYVYYGTATGIGQTPSLSFYGPNVTNYYFGSALAKGDIDNDGFPDLIVGASYGDATNTNRGGVYVFRSNSTTGAVDITSSTYFIHTGSANTDLLGFSVATFDYDGDGDLDLLAGAPGDDDTTTNSGMVYIWRNGTTGANAGTNTLLDVTHDATIADPRGIANYGFGSALYVGKYSNTSYPDLIVGAYQDDFNGTDAGSVLIFQGNSGGYDASPSVIAGLDPPAIDAGEFLGHAIVVLDINRDGTNDLLIGAPADDSPGTDSGSVYIKTEK